MVHASNDFSRWDAGQMLLAKYIRSNVNAVQTGTEIELPMSLIDAFRGVLLSDTLEPALIAEIMALPSHNEVSGWYGQIDVDAIAIVLKAIKVKLANTLEDELSAIYHSLKDADYTISHEAIGKRSLRNIALSYLAHTELGNKLVEKQYFSANNMTDTIAAMSAANNAQLDCREKLMTDYSGKWQHDGLVMDKWFSLCKDPTLLRMHWKSLNRRWTTPHLVLKTLIVREV